MTSELSIHEVTHIDCNEQSFYEFLTSYYIDDSWFIRHINNMTDNQIIEPYHFSTSIRYLKNFRVSDIRLVDDLIDDVFGKCYGIYRSNVEECHREFNIHKNSSTKSIDVELDDIDSEIKQKFLDRTYWDRELWKCYYDNIS